MPRPKKDHWGQTFFERRLGKFGVGHYPKWNRILDGGTRKWWIWWDDHFVIEYYPGHWVLKLNRFEENFQVGPFGLLYSYWAKRK